MVPHHARGARLLERARRARSCRACRPLSTLVELGPGSGEKLDGTDRRRAAPDPRGCDVHLVDVSAAALDAAARALVDARPDLDVVDAPGDVRSGLAEATRARARLGGRTLVLFLGSNIGNFDPPGADAFLRDIRAALRAGDALLLGADLVKPERELLLAYDDPLGVTAAFNRNLLVRINRELGGDFDLDRVRAPRGLERRRVARRDAPGQPPRQRVRVAAADSTFTFEEGEIDLDRELLQVRAGGDRRCARARPASACCSSGSIGEDGFALTLVEAT